MTMRSKYPYAWLVFFVAAVSITVASVLADHDDTDPPDGSSGMSLYTDAATGCQYLGSIHGGITPRLTPLGKHMGCR